MFEDLFHTQGLNYSQATAFVGIVGVLLIAVPTLLIFLLLRIAAKLITKRFNKQKVCIKPTNEETIELRFEASSNEAKKPLHSKEPNEKGHITTIIKILRISSAIISWISLLSFAFIPSLLSGFGVIPVWSSIILTMIAFLFKYLGLVFKYAPTNLEKNKDVPQKSTLSRFWRKIKVTHTRYQTWLGVYIGLAMIYSFGVPLITSGMCMNVFNQGYGVKFGDFGLSTKFTRYLTLDNACPLGKVCHLYATLPEDGSTSVIFNVHTGIDINTITIGYDLLQNIEDTDRAGVLSNTMIAQSYYADLEDRGNRYVHSTYLSNLTPNSEYYFEIYFNNATQANGTYRTLPSKALERNLFIAVGGDAGTIKEAQQMTSVLGNYPLDAILIGGDLGYNDGMRSCYYSIDLFMNMFESLNQNVGRIIPIIIAMGNHDVGTDAYQNGEIDISTNLHSIYYPQHSKADAQNNLLMQVPDPSERLSYSYHLLGNIALLTLDSSYVLGYDGVQSDFINNISTKYSDYVKFASYHVPMYPSCIEPEDNDPRTMTEARLYWGTLFEQYNFSSIFENHLHLYKKTFPISNGKPNPGGNGVTYFGDGNWGVAPNGCYSPDFGTNGNDTGVLEVVGSSRHVWSQSMKQIKYLIGNMSFRLGIISIQL